MPELSEQKLNKIKRIFGRLESDHAGEVENAVSLLKTILKNEGYTITTFINAIDGSSERDEDLLVYEDMIEKLENEVEELRKKLTQVSNQTRTQPHAQANEQFVAMAKAVFNGDTPGWKKRCADALGVSYSAVAHWISGKNVPSEQSQKKLEELMRRRR